MRKNESELTTPGRLNTRADKILITKLRAPILTHILNIPITIYIKHDYNPNKYVSTIRSRCG